MQPFFNSLVDVEVHIIEFIRERSAFIPAKVCSGQFQGGASSRKVANDMFCIISPYRVEQVFYLIWLN